MNGLVTEQPKELPIYAMDPYREYSKQSLPSTTELDCPDHYHTQGGYCERYRNRHKGCHKSRRRHFFIIFGILFLLAILLAAFCAYHSASSEGFSGFWSSTSKGLGGLLKRATNDPQAGNGVLIDRKYYLIIIFVGLLLVVILGIMLSAWCCRGAFENPLCCPCYLCACCGGLACLECIACGLCAEGADF